MRQAARSVPEAPQAAGGPASRLDRHWRASIFLPICLLTPKLYKIPRFIPLTDVTSVFSLTFYFCWFRCSYLANIRANWVRQLGRELKRFSFHFFIHLPRSPVDRNKKLFSFSKTMNVSFIQ